LKEQQTLPHISLVFREMWDTTNLNFIGLRPIRGDENG
jgi:hypothetical protein